MGNALVRFLVSVPGALLVASSFNYFNHKAYYATIRNTQTVNFNMLANTLPTKLSQALLNGDLGEVQRTVNSNYGLFGIVVTDCKVEQRECIDQQILAKSQPERKGWGEKQFPENLLEHPYDALRNPIPTTAEWEFKDARSTEIVPTGRLNQGKTIGRVYYIRRDPPEFVQEQKTWLLSPVESLQILTTTGDIGQAGKRLYSFIDSGANKYYLLTNSLGILTGLFIWRNWERILNKKRLQQKLYGQREKELIARNDRYRKREVFLERENRELKINEKYLTNELNHANEVLNEERQKTQALQDGLEEAKKASDLAKEKVYALTQQLKSAREQVSEKWRIVFSLQQQLDSIENSDNKTVELQVKLKKAILEASSSQQMEDHLTEQLRISSEDLENKEINSSKLSKEYLEALEILRVRESDIFYLQKNLSEISVREKHYQDSIESLHQQKFQLEAEKQQLTISLEKNQKQHNKNIDDLCNSLDREINDLKNKLDDSERAREALEEEKTLLQDKLNQLEAFENDEFDEGGIKFQCVLDALRGAENFCPNIEIWDSAEKSAYTLNYYLPNKVYQNLLILSDVGKSYFEKSVGSDLNEIFRNRGLTYSPRESPSTMGKYGNEREFWHRGKKRQMSRHLKVGRQLRIYFEFDEQQKKVQIGYCGKHLQTTKG